MGLRIVRVSTDLFNLFLTEGNEFPPGGNGKVVVTKGLPPHAKLVDVSMHAFFTTDEVALKYSHPSWPDEPAGHAIPEMRVEFARVMDPPAQSDAPAVGP